MPTTVVRRYSEFVKQQPAVPVEQRDRSLEVDARDIFTPAARPPHIGIALLQAGREVGGADGRAVPDRRDVARIVDLG